MKSTVKQMLLTILLLVPMVSLSAQTVSVRQFVPPAGGKPGSIQVLFVIPPEHYQSYEPEFFGIKMDESSPYRLGRHCLSRIGRKIRGNYKIPGRSGYNCGGFQRQR